MDDLDRLAEQFGTDKGTVKTGSLSPKGYTRHYARWFAPLREEPIRLLEIGVASGASLRMWEAWFPRAEIHGIDIDPACAAAASDRIRVHIGDQEDPGFLASVLAAMGGAPAIVIDDGGHGMRQHRQSLEALFPGLATGGIYAIEDLHTAYWARFGGGYRRSGSTVEFLKGLVDDVNGGVDVVNEGSALQRAAARFLGRRPPVLPPALARLESIHFCPSLAFLLAR
jgi:hypothetical protein